MLLSSIGGPIRHLGVGARDTRYPLEQDSPMEHRILLCPTWLSKAPIDTDVVKNLIYNDLIPEPDSLSHINTKNILQGFTVMLNFPRKQLRSREGCTLFCLELYQEMGTTSEIMPTMNHPSGYLSPWYPTMCQSAFAMVTFTMTPSVGKLLTTLTCLLVELILGIYILKYMLFNNR